MRFSPLLDNAAPLAAQNESMCPSDKYKLSVEGTPAAVGSGGYLDCDDVSEWGDDEDKRLCATVCTASTPCLFDVVHDEGERHDLAAQMPDKA